VDEPVFGDLVELAGPSVPGAGLGVMPPGGMGVTSQGFGQEGYRLSDSDIGPQPAPAPEDQSFVTGVPYFLPFATPYRDSWEVFREDPVTISQLVSMRRQDGQARALYRLLTMPLLAALKNCDVIPVDGQTGGQQEAQFCKDLLTLPASSGGMTHSFGRFIRQMLLALFNGFSAWEMVYWQPTTGPWKGKYTLRKLDWRPAETLTFLLDGQGEFNGFRQRTFFQGRTIDVKIPKDTSVYYAHEEAERPFYGVSMFESAFYHYDKKTKLYYIAHLAAQRAAVGMRVGTMPPNPAARDKDNFIRGLADLGLAQYMVVPSADWIVQSLKEEGNFDFLGLINHHNSEMSKSVLAQWFDQQQGGGQGDSSLVDFGKQSDVTFMMMLDGILEEMAEVITQHIFPRFVDWNFGSGKYPQFKWGALTGEQKAAIQDTFDKLASAGQNANVTPQFMLELERRMAEDFGFDIDYDTIEDEQEEQHQLQQKVNEVQARAQIQQLQNPQPQGAGSSAGGSAGNNAGSSTGSGSSGSGASSGGASLSRSAGEEALFEMSRQLVDELAGARLLEVALARRDPAPGDAGS
jgi:uncharacterized membrane protein YgcG